MAKPERMVFKIDEAAEALALSRSYVYVLIGRGEIPVTRVGRAVRIPRSALEEFIARNTRPAKED